MLYVASGLIGVFVMTRISDLRRLFRRSQLPPDGHERASIRERNWYRKTEKEKISAQKALS